MENEFRPNDGMQDTAAPDVTLKHARQHFSKIGLMFFFGTLLVYGVQLVASLIAGTINPDLFNNTNSAVLISMIPMYVIALPLMMFLISRIPAAPVPKRNMTVGQWFVAFIMCYGGMYVGNLVGIAIAQFISVIKGSSVNNAILEIATDSSLWVNFFIMVLCAPVFEELIFRKLLIDRTVKYGESVAVLFSGLMFGLFHGNLNQFTYAFILGLFFGFIYVKTGQVRYVILLHMLINFFGSVLSILMMNLVDMEAITAALSDPELMTSYMTGHLPQLLLYCAYTFGLLGISVAGIILFIVKIKKVHLLSGEIKIPKGKGFSVTVLNVGMILYFVFWIIMIVIQLFA